MKGSLWPLSPVTLPWCHHATAGRISASSRRQGWIGRSWGETCAALHHMVLTPNKSWEFIGHSARIGAGGAWTGVLACAISYRYIRNPIIFMQCIYIYIYAYWILLSCIIILTFYILSEESSVSSLARLDWLYEIVWHYALILIPELPVLYYIKR